MDGAWFHSQSLRDETSVMPEPPRRAGGRRYVSPLFIIAQADAGHFVGERDGDEFARLAEQQRPATSPSSAGCPASWRLDHRGGAGDEQTRNRSLPARLMPPMRCLPPVECSFGVRPTQAARWRPDSNAAGSISVASVNAMTGPTPGIVACGQGIRHGTNDESQESKLIVVVEYCKGIVAMNITRLPPSKRTIHVEAEIPISQRDEFDRAMVEIVAGERPRMDALDRDETSIHSRAMQALQGIEATIKAHPTTGQSRRLVRFLAGVYNGQDYPFDLTELRARYQSGQCLPRLSELRSPRQDGSTQAPGQWRSRFAPLARGVRH